MTGVGWIQIGLFCLAVTVCVKPLGLYMAKVFDGEWAFLAPVERVIWRLCGIRNGLFIGGFSYNLGFFSVIGSIRCDRRVRFIQFFFCPRNF